MITLIIPVVSKTREYTNNILKNIREIYPDETQVEIIVEENDNVSLGINYNNAVAKASGNKIILLHNDMIIKPGFVETMDRDIVKNRITTYTRLEPPIYNDTYPGKVILDCGTDLNSFNKEKFFNYNIDNCLSDGGSQLFFGCLKEDYIGIDGHTFKMFCEDDDLHLRYRLAGFEHKVSSAHVYHFVSKTSRTTKNYQQIEMNSNRNFIRKWGIRNPKVKYNIGYVVHNCNIQLLETLELFCDNLYVNCDIQSYLINEQPNTTFNLKDRIRPYMFGDTHKPNDILIEFDASKLNQNNFQILQQMPDIIMESAETGYFELDIFKLTIKNMNEYQTNLIRFN